MDGVPYNPRRNSNLKGRKRFSADFADIQEACASGLVLHGFKLKSLSNSSKIPSNTKTNLEIHPGEDEGSFEVMIENRGKHVLSATLLVSGKWPTTYR
jgi:ubiquitin-conjugating enzyme E2 Q